MTICTLADQKNKYREMDWKKVVKEAQKLGEKASKEDDLADVVEEGHKLLIAVHKDHAERVRHEYTIVRLEEARTKDAYDIDSLRSDLTKQKTSHLEKEINDTEWHNKKEEVEKDFADKIMPALGLGVASDGDNDYREQNHSNLINYLERIKLSDDESGYDAFKKKIDQGDLAGAESLIVDIIGQHFKSKYIKEVTGKLLTQDLDVHKKLAKPLTSKLNAHRKDAGLDEYKPGDVARKISKAYAERVKYALQKLE